MTDTRFRFISDPEFAALDIKARAVYLVRAQQELEMRQEIIRAQRKALTAKIAALGEKPE